MARVALGFVETRGNTGALHAIDAMLKTANVELVKRVEIGGAYVTAIVSGEVGAVRSSIEAGAEAAAKIGELISTNIIPSAHEEVFARVFPAIVGSTAIQINVNKKIGALLIIETFSVVSAIKAADFAPLKKLIWIL